MPEMTDIAVNAAGPLCSITPNDIMKIRQNKNPAICNSFAFHLTDLFKLKTRKEGSIIRMKSAIPVPRTIIWLGI